MTVWTTLNSLDLQHGSLSADNLTFFHQNSDGSTDGLVRAVRGHNNRKRYFEAAMTYPSVGSYFNTGIGLCTLAATNTDLGTAATHGALVQSFAGSGQANVDGVNKYSNFPHPRPTSVSVAVDLDAKRLWLASAERRIV